MRAATSLPTLGAQPVAERRCSFTVWAPAARTVELHLHTASDRTVPLESVERGYFTVLVDDVGPGDLYRFRLDGERELADPASRFQPEGVHGPSAVVAREFEWSDDAWRGLRLRDYLIYELHVGTFTHAGTFGAVMEHLPYLRDLGVTALELMPVAEFPGHRNWGYDGVFPYAAQSSYGGPAALKRLVDACHAHELAVILDVVYNHLGPEGNHLTAFGPYFTARHRTPWGPALNFDGPHSDEVREFFIQNALQWTREFHIDALRLDAVHAILDTSALPFLQELADRVHEDARARDRHVVLIAESDLADPRMIRPPTKGGHGMDAQWLDDFHHSLHTLLTGETQGYYSDYCGIEPLARSFREGFVYAGQYSNVRMRRHGVPAPDAQPEQFVVFIQNHDQIGNRFAGDRLAATLSLEWLKLAAATVLLSPFSPLLFMGEEYGEVAPFPYFISHTDPQLIEAVRAGRKAEFSAFAWADEPPDPEAEETFSSARLDHQLRQHGQHQVLHAFYRELIRVRREHPVLRRFEAIDARVEGDTLLVFRHAHGSAALLALNFSDGEAAIAPDVAAGSWTLVLDSAAPEWRLNGDDDRSAFRAALDNPRLAPHSAVLLVRQV
jgi:maltooligosyltrehalose trehalohydrolase